MSQDYTIEQSKEYKEMQQNVGVIQELANRARDDLLTCIRTISSKDREKLTEAALSLSRNILALEQFSAQIAKEMAIEKFICSTLAKTLDDVNGTSDVSIEEISVPVHFHGNLEPETKESEQDAPKSVNIVHPDADENVIARGEIPHVQQVDDLAFKEEDKNAAYKKWIEKDTFIHRGNPYILDLKEPDNGTSKSFNKIYPLISETVAINGMHVSTQEVARLAGRGETKVNESVDDFGYTPTEVKGREYDEFSLKRNIDDKLSQQYEREVSESTSLETDRETWVKKIKEDLERDKVRTILDRKVYFIAANPIINESLVHEEPDYVNITQYIEVIDAETLKYILVERRAKGVDIKDTILFEVDDRDVVEDHIYGRVNRHRYVGQDNRLTALSVNLIKKNEKGREEVSQ